MAVAAQLQPKEAPKRRVYYPTRDGKPVGETDKHRDLTFHTIEALKVRYAALRNVYVSGNNFIYWEEGNPKARISPDTYVIFEVPMRQRDLYKAWEEGGRLPNVVFEFTSKKTRYEDTHKKRPLYEQILRVQEYFQFDPTGDYLKPRLQGLRLVGGRYVELPLVDGRLHSEQLGLDLVQEGERMRLYDPQRAEWLPTPIELARRAEQAVRRAEQAVRRAEQEALRAEEAEAEVARLRAQLEALRGRGETNEH